MPIYDMLEYQMVKRKIPNGWVSRLIYRSLYVTIVAFVAISIPFFGSLLVSLLQKYRLSLLHPSVIVGVSVSSELLRLQLVQMGDTAVWGFSVSDQCLCAGIHRSCRLWTDYIHIPTRCGKPAYTSRWRARSIGRVFGVQPICMCYHDIWIQDFDRPVSNKTNDETIS